MALHCLASAMTLGLLDKESGKGQRPVRYCQSVKRVVAVGGTSGDIVICVSW
jgi:hypothetical protein